MKPEIGIFITNFDIFNNSCNQSNITKSYNHLMYLYIHTLITYHHIDLVYISIVAHDYIIYTHVTNMIYCFLPSLYLLTFPSSSPLFPPFLTLICLIDYLVDWLTAWLIQCSNHVWTMLVWLRPSVRVPSIQYAVCSH